ncbi:MAG: helix-turn-helix domain-containing protein [Blautia caecimuris]
MNLSERIKDMRKEKGLTQKELAKKTGLSIASIQGYEQGKYKPKIEQLEKIISCFRMFIV